MDQNFTVSKLARGMTVVLAGLFAVSLAQPMWANAAGSVSGRVVLVGDAPQPKKLKVTKDNEKCGSEVVDEDLAVSTDKGIKNAVVSVVGVKGKPAQASPVLDQSGCVFKPRVVVVPVGAPLDILNNDGILHNVHTLSSKNTAINKAQPGFKKKMSETFSQAETFKVNCDAHSWMTGWVVVTDAPAASSDAGGAFKLTDVPAGNHTLEIWHETLGKITKQISVKDGEDTKITIELSKK
jgi:plastocyanin